MAAALGCYRRIAVNIGLYIVTSWDLKFHFRLRRLWGVFFGVEAYLAQAWRVSCKMGGFCDSRGMWVKGREDAGKMGMIRDVCGLWVAGRKSTRDPDLSLNGYC